MSESKITGSSQRNAKDVASELTELYYRVSKEEAKSPEEVGETYVKIYNLIKEARYKTNYKILFLVSKGIIL